MGQAPIPSEASELNALALSELCCILTHVL